MLSHHSVAALNAKETQGTEKEKDLARLAKRAIGSDQLKISSNQPANGIFQFGIECNQGVLVIKTKLNERLEDDVLSVGFRRGSEAPVSMTLPRPSTAVVGTARHPSALLGLPNELLLQIAGSTARQSEGINLSLRRVSKHMKLIADDQMSSRQRFLTEHAQTLSASGYGRASMEDLLHLSPAQQNFALTNGPRLHATAGYNGYISMV
ncbi:hypothetical protein [Pseudomonas asuensis]|uniref:hypothetical protein n=1 Tax=Pseudomonas asuensis TaxID=1825787 RepID=UPI00188C90FC|nr:hypothetical protein [Pseudomonas asuensis]